MTSHELARKLLEGPDVDVIMPCMDDDGASGRPLESVDTVTTIKYTSGRYELILSIVHMRKDLIPIQCVVLT